jgi:sporulation protein YlmC with PRC-barrel domain
MTPQGPIKLVSALLDLPLLDADGKYCGIVDDVELQGGAGKDLELKALLVGPGAYRGRMPARVMSLIETIAGERIVKVPVDKVRNIAAVVQLDCSAAELGLDRSEAAARKWVPRRGAL